MSVEEAILGRRSVRQYADRPLSLKQAAQLLWATGGSTVDGVSGPTRAAPSAGGIYPIDIYLLAGKVDGLKPGLYRYDGRGHALVKLKDGDLRGEVSKAALGQFSVRGAPASIILAADPNKVEARYGKRGVERYLPMDAGHAGQNIALQAQALGLGTVMVGAFSDRQMQTVLGIEDPVWYVIPVGVPAR